MSTDLDRALKQGLLRPVVPFLMPGKLPSRQLWATPEFDQWAATLPSRAVTGSLTPIEELDAILARFVAGERVLSSLRWVTPRGRGCVALHTPSLRLAGYVPGIQSIILCDGALVTESHGDGAKNKNALAKAVIRQRSALRIDWRVGELYEFFSPSA